MKNISGYTEATFVKLGFRNVYHKRNKMTPVVLLPWQQFCCWSCLIKTISSFCLNQGPSTPANLITRVKTIWLPCLFQTGGSVLLQRVENEDILVLTKRDWSQENVHDNNTMGIVWSLLWWTFEEHCFYIPRDALHTVSYHLCCKALRHHHHFPNLHNTETSASPKQKRYSKNENAIVIFFFFLKSLSNKWQFVVHSVVNLSKLT